MANQVAGSQTKLAADVEALNSNMNKLLVIEKNATIAAGSSGSFTSTSVDVSTLVPDGYSLLGCSLGGYTLPYYDNNGSPLVFAQRFTSNKTIVIKNKTEEWTNEQIRALFIKP